MLKKVSDGTKRIQISNLFEECRIRSEQLNNTGVLRSEFDGQFLQTHHKRSAEKRVRRQPNQFKILFKSRNAPFQSKIENNKHLIDRMMFEEIISL
jgi:hypothetical protein